MFEIFFFIIVAAVAAFLGFFWFFGGIFALEGTWQEDRNTQFVVGIIWIAGSLVIVWGWISIVRKLFKNTEEKE